MLNNPYYIGVVVYRASITPASMSRLVSYQLFERCRWRSKRPQHAGERQYRHNHYLKGSVYCGTCGSDWR